MQTSLARPHRLWVVLLSVLAMLLLSGTTAEAQRRSRGRPAPAAKPASRPSPQTRPAQPAARPTPATRPTTGQAGTANRPNAGTANRPNAGNANAGNRGNTNSGNRGNVNSGNRGDVNIGNRGNNNINVNIDNSHDVNVRRNTTVVVAPRPYPRPPYAYGGFRYYSYRPYWYHPYTPYYWGPSWHPWGFFVAALATTAIVVSVNNQQYHYDQGTWYGPVDGGYQVVTAPVGGTVKEIPSGAQTVVVNETTNNYYYGGTYYEKSGEGYTVVPPTAGTVVDHLPEGAEEVTIGDQKYVKYGETYYMPVQVDGKGKYEVANVEKAG